MPVKWEIGPVALLVSQWMDGFLQILHKANANIWNHGENAPNRSPLLLGISQNISRSLKSLPTRSPILFGNFPKGSPIPNRHWPTGLQQVVSTFPSVSPLK